MQFDTAGLTDAMPRAGSEQAFMGRKEWMPGPLKLDGGWNPGPGVCTASGFAAPALMVTVILHQCKFAVPYHDNGPFTSSRQPTERTHH